MFVCVCLGVWNMYSSKITAEDSDVKQIYNQHLQARGETTSKQLSGEHDLGVLILSLSVACKIMSAQPFWDDAASLCKLCLQQCLRP